MCCDLIKHCKGAPQVIFHLGRALPRLELLHIQHSVTVFVEIFEHGFSVLLATPK
jgi:hypothetical protein